MHLLCNINILIYPSHSIHPFHFPLSFLFIHPFPFSFSFASLPFPFFKEQRCALKMADCKHGEDFYDSQEHQGTGTGEGKKYGGLVPKKKPLISKDHERAFFDSADWALCKQGAGVNQKSTVAIETLRPKLQRTPHQQLPPRRPAFTSARENIAQ